MNDLAFLRQMFFSRGYVAVTQDFLDKKRIAQSTLMHLLPSNYVLYDNTEGVFLYTDDLILMEAAREQERKQGELPRSRIEH